MFNFVVLMVAYLPHLNEGDYSDGMLRESEIGEGRAYTTGADECGQLFVRTNSSTQGSRDCIGCTEDLLRG